MITAYYVNGMEEDINLVLVGPKFWRILWN